MKVLQSIIYYLLVFSLGMTQIIFPLVKKIFVPAIDISIIKIALESSLLFCCCTILSSLILEYYFYSKRKLKQQPKVEFILMVIIPAIILFFSVVQYESLSEKSLNISNVITFQIILFAAVSLYSILFRVFSLGASE